MLAASQLKVGVAFMQGTEPWQLLDGDKVVSVRPQGRFKADNGTALAVAAVAGLGGGVAARRHRCRTPCQWDPAGGDAELSTALGGHLCRPPAGKAPVT